MSFESKNIEIKGAVAGAHGEILTHEALDFLAALHREFEPRRQALLNARQDRQARIDQGDLPAFLPETENIRAAAWTVDPVPPDFVRRQVEITGPVDRKMVINALNSGVDCFMADFEDAHSPVWESTLDGQVNMRDANRRQLSFQSPDGREYRLNEKIATLIVRPRGWHLPEKHLLVDGQPISASLFDFGLYLFHNGRQRLNQGAGIYYYLPKLQHYLEARLWNDVFVRAQERLNLPAGSIKATVLIEHILAAFQMDEILCELRQHSAGLNCGRWDYLFSYIKTFAAKENFIIPDRAQVTMTAPLMRAYSLLCIKTCHRRGTFAMGGMSAFIPIKSDPAANETALRKVQEDKQREASDGHDGTWVAHPGLVQTARAEFARVLGNRPNQIDRLRNDVNPSPAQLIEPPKGTLTETGLRLNIRVAIQYLEAWLGGLGCVPLYNLMEDAATAEISRAQVWQCIHNPRGVLDDGRKVTLELARALIAEEAARITQERGPLRRLDAATRLFEKLVSEPKIAEFLTLPAYELLP